jgi:hypothetical protein
MNTKSLSRVLLLVVGVFSLAGCGVFLPQRADSLQLVEYQLAAAPEAEALKFTPVQGTQDEIMLKHIDQRTQAYESEVSMIEGNPTIASIGDNDNLHAVVETSLQGEPEQTIRLFQDDTLIFETAAGLPSPVLPLQGLWTYDEHWALELLLSDQDTWSGEIFIDGELVNRILGYEEAFGFQLLSGKPFFFFNRDDQLGYSYDAQEFDLNYDEIPHYRCCGEDSLNAIQAKSMVSFFALRDQAWFYVELGNFTE